jgi:hypothetical protein
VAAAATSGNTLFAGTAVGHMSLPRVEIMNIHSALATVALLALTGCSDEAYGSVSFTTWGEAYIEEGIGAGAGGFVDGWSVKYDKFLVNFHQIRVATAAGEVADASPESFFVDNVVAGRKKLVTFSDVTAKNWDRVSYQIKPASASAKLVAGTQEDLDMMVAAGYSLYVQGTASKGEVVKTFAWGFTTGTQYDECHSEQNGKETAGIVVTDGAEDTSELTTRGDHFFYDRLQGSAGSNIQTALRFDNVAAADADGDITLEELENQPIDGELYDPSGLPAANMKDFVSGLSRTVGHFRGAGECTISEAE